MTTMFACRLSPRACCCWPAVRGQQVPGDARRNYDGLTDLFHLFIRNRERPGSQLSVGNLATSWIGYWWNWLNLRLSMDNSLTGSKPNIEAHYDLSNELFRTFLDDQVSGISGTAGGQTAGGWAEGGRGKGEGLSGGKHTCTVPLVGQAEAGAGNREKRGRSGCDGDRD